ncbi:MAG: hypothetical protein OXF05_05125 [Hyphomicrobiales bacterium]|nr:hypothetical protein [Hyphomicrobiales bacterium]MCY4038362.1 hypothetical protein [Hyphomicrobiales bacterium]
MTASPHLPQLTDLGRSLASDSNGVFYRRLCDHLQEQMRSARAVLDKGVAGEHARRLETEIAGLDNARRIVEVVWGVLHVNTTTEVVQ